MHEMMTIKEPPRVMENKDSAFIPLAEIVETLKRLCWEKRSGTLYLLTDKGHCATISLSQGNIIEVFHMMKRGMQAVVLLRTMPRARYFFKNDLRLRDNPPSDLVELPSNEVIFHELLMQGTASEMASDQRHLQKRILVVEDSAMARRAVVTKLSDKGYYIIEAKDGEEALNMIRDLRPDLVLLDLILPKIDGYEVLSQVRSSKEHKSLPVIALTSRDALFDKLKGKMSGTDEYLTKPVDPEKLLEKVAKYLG